MVILLSVGSWEVRKKANTRNLLNFQLSCTRANLPCANLFKYCSYKFHLRCWQGGGRSCGLCCLCKSSLLTVIFQEHSFSLILFFFLLLTFKFLLCLLFFLSFSRKKCPNIRVEISFCVLLCCLLYKISNVERKDISDSEIIQGRYH